MELGSRGRRHATRIVAVGVVVGALTIGSTVHAAPAGDGLSGTIVVSVGGAVRAVDVPTFSRRVAATST